MASKEPTAMSHEPHGQASNNQNSALRVSHQQGSYARCAQTSPRPTRLFREDCWGNAMVGKPDSENPTVRDEMERLVKRGLWWNCEPTLQTKGQNW